MGVITGTMLAVGAGLALAGAGAGIGISALAGAGKDKGQQQAQMPAAPEVPKIEDASAKANLAAEERRRAMARSKSVNTNPLGISDEASVARKKLLGG
jgi:hypothetical protein